MKLTLGYSREHPGGTKWTKADVTIEHEEFRNFLSLNEIDPDTPVKAHLIFQWMNAEAEIFLAVKQKGEGLMSAETVTEYVGTLRKAQDKVLAEIKESVK